jgi:winged helix DNA-binding protein
MTLRVTWRQALSWRMERQLLDPRGDLPAVEIVRRLAGVQAQVASSAEFAIRARQSQPEANGADIRAALADGRLIKTWAMRGTLHLFAADDAGRYLSLIAAGRSWEAPAWERYFGLSPAGIERLRHDVRAILDGRVMTREELNAEIVKRPGYGHLADHLKSGWGMLFKPLAWQGDICFGPSRGTRVTFARPEQLSSDWQPLPDAEDAAPIVIATYLGTYGPATPRHLAKWLSRGRVGARTLKAWFESLGDAVAKVDVDGEEMYVRSADVDALAASKPRATVRLLGGFEQWVLGPGTDDAHVIPPGRRSAVSKTAGWIAPIVTLGGVVSGTWTLEPDRVAVCWFSECGKPPSVGLDEEVARLSAVVGRPLSLVVTRC